LPSLGNSKKIIVPVEPQTKCAPAQIGALQGNCGNYVAWLSLLAGSHFLSELVVRWQILGRFKNWKSLSRGTVPIVADADRWLMKIKASGVSSEAFLNLYLVEVNHAQTRYPGIGSDDGYGSSGGHGLLLRTLW
jgi:hypothetical protein